ncbi:MAG: hypothetical protein AMR96_06410 [Candidatus Adiutrix intracellularis]|jgi:MFS family permease|nr:MAG: hypothetical protein AMR96_06410 [Candidatus Adiutrix intracellularis]MDR2826477.1 MFS transporter [Candidatus Adiutrix intracellularis]
MNTFRRILAQRDFWPLFGAQAFGAFNDNFFRSALIAFVAFEALNVSNFEKTIISSLATGLMMLPFFIFSSLSGELSDRCPKSSLLKIIKGAEVVIMLLAAFFFVSGHIYALLIILFLMGLQSTFFGPLKYSLLPEVLEDEFLVAGNGLVEGVTFLAIVLGTMAGSWLVTIPGGREMYLPAGLVLAAILGLLMALKQPHSVECNPGLKINLNLFRSTYEIVASIKNRRDIWLTVIGISWFWAVGSILITQIPILCSTILGGTPGVSTFLVTMFALGVAIGSVAAHFFLQGRVSANLVPVSATLMAVFIAGLAYSAWRLPSTVPASVGLDLFFSQWVYIRLGLSCLMASITGGLFAVPLNALLQHFSEIGECSRVMAANNIVNSLFICLGSLLVMFFISQGAGLPVIFTLLAVSALAVAVLSLYFLPEYAGR